MNIPRVFTLAHGCSGVVVYIGPGLTEEYRLGLAATLSSVPSVERCGVDVCVHPLLKAGEYIIAPAFDMGVGPLSSTIMNELLSKIETLHSSGSDTKLT